MGNIFTDYAGRINQGLNNAGIGSIPNLLGQSGGGNLGQNQVYNPGNGGGNINNSVTGGYDAAGHFAGNGGQQVTMANAAPTGNNRGGTTAPQVDHTWDAWGGQANYNNLMNNFNTQKQGILDSTNQAGAAAGQSYGRSIEDTMDALRQNQNKINGQGMQNELAKRQGTQGVLGMVSRGLKQGGTMLAQKNATNSSATEALAKAYADLGRRQMSNVGNQYETGNREVASAQYEQDLQKSRGVKRLGEDKNTIVNSIVSDAQNKLGQLQGAMAGASLGDRINIQQEIANVRQNAMNQLQGYDSVLSEKAAGVQATNLDQRRSAALAAASAGTAPENAFNFTTQAPVQLQGGQASSNLPIYTMPRGARRE